MEKSETGRRGELAAENFLIEKGFEILERNYRYKRAEIDLIVKSNNLIVFVEVKTRTSTTFGQPEDFVGTKKTENVLAAADHYIFEKNWLGNIRFDIVSITFGKTVEIFHIEDAFY